MVDNGSDPPGENLTNFAAAIQVLRLIPGIGDTGE